MIYTVGTYNTITENTRLNIESSPLSNFSKYLCNIHKLTYAKDHLCTVEVRTGVNFYLWRPWLSVKGIMNLNSTTEKKNVCSAYYAQFNLLKRINNKLQLQVSIPIASLIWWLPKYRFCTFRKDLGLHQTI